MCSLNGFLSEQATVHSATVIEEMNDALYHRGPDAG